MSQRPNNLSARTRSSESISVYEVRELFGNYFLCIVANCLLDVMRAYNLYLFFHSEVGKTFLPTSIQPERLASDSDAVHWKALILTMGMVYQSTFFFNLLFIDLINFLDILSFAFSIYVPRYYFRLDVDMRAILLCSELELEWKKCPFSFIGVIDSAMKQLFHNTDILQLIRCRVKQ